MTDDTNNGHYTYNPLTNDDKKLLLKHGYVPGELSPEDERDILEDLKAGMEEDDDADRRSSDVSPDERDGAQ